MQNINLLISCFWHQVFYGFKCQNFRPTGPKVLKSATGALGLRFAIASFLPFCWNPCWFRNVPPVLLSALPVVYPHAVRKCSCLVQFYRSIVIYQVFYSSYRGINSVILLHSLATSTVRVHTKFEPTFTSFTPHLRHCVYS